MIDNAVEAIGKLDNKKKLGRLKEKMLELVGKVTSINVDEVREYIKARID